MRGSSAHLSLTCTGCLFDAGGLQYRLHIAQTGQAPTNNNSNTNNNNTNNNNDSKNNNNNNMLKYALNIYYMHSNIVKMHFLPADQLDKINSTTPAKC